MNKILSHIFSPLHYLVFGLILIIFHPIQWVCLKIGGYSGHKKSVDVMNLLLFKSLWLMGARLRFEGRDDLPTDRPLIIVANHNSQYDIPAFFWYMRKHHVKFVAKKELGKGIPSVSFNLRHGGSVLIDRKDRRQSITALKGFSEYLEKNNYAGVIFPEGTRSRTGEPKRFSPAGLTALLKYAPSALVVPVTIYNTWELHRYGKYPLGFGARLRWEVHAPVEPAGRSVDEVLAEVEHIITERLTAKTT